MQILMFDTSVDSLAVGVAKDEAIFCANSSGTEKHAEILLPMIGDCLAAAGLRIEDIGLIACTSGPGSFMGLRIGMSTAKGLALARSTPWVCLPTLDTFAAEFADSGKLVVPLIDARKKRVYAALYREGVPISDYLDIEPAKLYEMLVAGDEDVLLAGPGTALLSEFTAGDARFGDARFGVGTSDPRLRFARFAELAATQFTAYGSAAEDAVPLYIREPEIG